MSARSMCVWMSSSAMENSIVPASIVRPISSSAAQICSASGGREQPDLGEHPGVGLAGADVVPVQPAVEGDRLGERLDAGIGPALEPPAPGFLAHRTARPQFGFAPRIPRLYDFLPPLTPAAGCAGMDRGRTQTYERENRCESGGCQPWWRHSRLRLGRRVNRRKAAEPTIEVRLRSVNELLDKAEYVAGWPARKTSFRG